MARVTWDFACVFVCFDSGILFVSFEKVFILALEGTRFLSLLTLNLILLERKEKWGGGAERGRAQGTGAGGEGLIGLIRIDVSEIML